MTDSDITFGKKIPILIKNVRVQNNPIEIYLDGTGYIGDISERIRDHDAELVIDGHGATVLPGMINMHTHSPMTLLRGYSDDLPLMDWLSKIWVIESKFNESAIYWGAKLACLEMIRTGTTTFNDMYFMISKIADAVDESGIRACLSYCMIDNGDHNKFESECSIMEQTVHSIKKRNNPRILPGVSPHAIYTVSEEGLQWCAEYSKMENIPLHIHVDETDEDTKCIQNHGMRVVPWLEHCGVLSPHCIAAHCCWVNNSDIELLSKHHVTVVHNPISNMKLAVGNVLPYPKLKKAGVNVTLGTDGAASNNNLDMFDTMKTAALLQKFHWNDSTIMPAQEVLDIASKNGAKALNIKSGVLAPGYLADIILVNKNPTNTPIFNTPSSMVYSTCGLAVNTTICDGAILMHNGYIPNSNEILTNAEKIAYDLTNYS